MLNKLPACQVYQLNHDWSAKQGQYIDLKAHPERANELPESKEWPALGEFIRSINETPLFRTTGCNVSGATPGSHTAPYVDIAFVDDAVARSRAACALLAKKILCYDGIDVANDCTIELRASSAFFPDGYRVSSLRLWFLGERDAAVAASPIILDLCKGQSLSSYTDAVRRKAMRRRVYAALGRVFPEKAYYLILSTTWVVFVLWIAVWAGIKYGLLGVPLGLVVGVVLFQIAFFVMEWIIDPESVRAMWEDAKAGEN
jgi:hypothetical protein